MVPLSLRMAVPALQLLGRECSISILSPDTSILGVLFHLRVLFPGCLRTAWAAGTHNFVLPF